MQTTTSPDGTVIAYDRVGQGPPLVICVGAFCTRHTFVPPDVLRERFTVVTYDRRGRGDSGDTPPYAPQREYEDLAAVVAAIGAERPVIFAHSSGAAIALRAVAAGQPAAAVVAYEAPFWNDDTPRPAVDPIQHLSGLLAEGRNRDAVMFWMAEFVRLPDKVLANLDRLPWVKDMEPLASTLPYELTVSGGGVPVAELARIAVPVLILGGSNSPAWFRRSVAEQAAAIPGAQLHTLDGFDHNCPPEVIAPILIDFATEHASQA